MASEDSKYSACGFLIILLWWFLTASGHCYFLRIYSSVFEMLLLTLASFHRRKNSLLSLWRWFVSQKRCETTDRLWAPRPQTPRDTPAAVALGLWCLFDGEENPENARHKRPTVKQANIWISQRRVCWKHCMYFSQYFLRCKQGNVHDDTRHKGY